MKVLLFVAVLLTQSFALAENINVTVKGMVCSFCAQGVTKKFKAEDSVEKIDVSLETKIVSIVLKDGKTMTDEKITTLLTDSGYNVEKIQRDIQ